MAECGGLRHPRVPLLILIELRTFMKTHPRLFFLNHPGYLGAVWPWQQPDKGMSNTVYKNLIPSCVPVQVSLSDSTTVGCGEEESRTAWQGGKSA